MRANLGLAIITGGTGGIGHCLSEGFAAAGYQVVALDHICHRPLSADIELMLVDLQDISALTAAFEQIKERHGSAHVLVNNAAIASFRKDFLSVRPEEWDLVMSVNLKAAFFCAQSFARLNSGQSYGRIVNVASTRWYQNEARHDVYGASKGGMVSLTQSLCVSLSDTPITVNTVSPGWIETGNYEALADEDHRQHPSGRVGKPEDILRACLFFAQPENDFVNGAHLVVDGGMTKRMIYV